MNFSDYTSYPAVANPNYSPINEAFSYPEALDRAYLADSYTTSPDHSLASFFDCDSYFDDRPLSSIEVPASEVLASKNPGIFNATLPTTSSPQPAINSSHSPTFHPAPFGQLEQFPSSFSFDGVCNPFESSESPQTQHSRTPSLCGDGPQPSQVPSSPEVSPLPALKREPTDEGVDLDEEPMPKRPQRKRGRPRLDQSNSDTSTSPKCQRTSRLPHNQVERKYREGLNSELERLRRAVPTLPQSEEGGGVMGQPKPSKAMVLAGAIDYIKKIEKERDMYRDEIERLRRIAHQGRNKDNRADSVSEFLMDP